MADLLEAAVEDNGGFGSHFGVNVVLGDVPKGVSVRISKQSMSQVMANLISNAVKFSPENEEVEVRAMAGVEVVRVEVLDRGPGVPMAFRERMFDKFTQADAGADRQKGGTGLGLALAKSIVDQHGGEIGVDDRSGGGSVFWVELAR